MGVARTQGVADLIDRNAASSHRFSIARLADADRTLAAMFVTEAIQQILVSFLPVATAVAMHLREQRGIALGYRISLAHITLETLWIESYSQLLPGAIQAAGRARNRRR